MRRLDFNEASELIKAVDAELEALLSAIWDQATKVCQRDLCFFLAKYPYAHFVLKDGKALAPDGRPLAPDLLVAGRMPVGLVLDNLPADIDEIIRSEEGSKRPPSLLSNKKRIRLCGLIAEQP